MCFFLIVSLSGCGWTEVRSAVVEPSRAMGVNGEGNSAVPGTSDAMVDARPSPWRVGSQGVRPLWAAGMRWPHVGGNSREAAIHSVGEAKPLYLPRYGDVLRA